MKVTTMKKHSVTALLLGLILALALAACADQQPTAAPEAEPTEAPAVEEPTAVPEATEAPAETVDVEPTVPFADVADQLWVLVAYGDAANPIVVPEGTLITAVFSTADNTVSGSGGCNNYFGGFTAGDDGSLTIEGPLGATMMACETGMEAEAAYLAALQTATGWTLNAEGRLVITYDTGQLVYTPGEAPLAETVWRLESFGDPAEPTPVLEGIAITAVFTPETDTTGQISGNASCNNYFGGYTIDGDAITFGTIGSTTRACLEGEDQEMAFLAALQSAQTFQITGSSLQIVYDGGVLNFSSLNLPLENVLWQAVMIVGLPVPEDVAITALFTPGDEAGAGFVGGNAGCNSYNTGYEVSDDTLTVDAAIATTMMLCPDEALAELEQTYLSALPTAETYTILGDQLVINTANGPIQFAADREPLLGTFWTLVSLGDVNDPQPPVEGANFTAEFNRLPGLPSGTVSGETGCNQYNATFAANLTEIKVNLPATTLRDCGEAQAMQEAQFFLGLSTATTYRILGNALQIPFGEADAQQVLNFVATQPPVEEVEAMDLTPLQDTFWYLSAFDDRIILPGTQITAQFSIDESGTTGTVSGSGGCNGYNAGIGPNFAIGPIASTARACEQPVMDQEATYFTWLQSAFTFDRVGDQLLVSTASGVLTFNSTPILNQANELVDRTWFLTAYESSNVIRGTNPTAVFAVDGSLGGTTGCNDYNGSYTTGQGNVLTISNIANTLTACPSTDVSNQEAAFLRLMPTATRYSINGNSLQIVTSSGATMNFTSVPPEAPQAPTAVIVSETTAEVGQTLTFDGAQSQAGSTRIVSHSWNMGDGTSLSGATVQYAYNTPGTYTVQLVVVDRAGLSSSATQTVQITPVAELTPPTAVIEGPESAFVGESVTFSAARSSQGSAAIASFQWQSGDGNNTSGQPENTFTTIYAWPGIYFPSVTVIDANGLSDSASRQIVVNATLNGTPWVLGTVIPGTSITLEFGNGALNGFAGCNSYSATYSSTMMAGPSNNITVGPIVAGGALCSEEIMQQEQAFLAALQSASAYAISGDTLTLTTESGPLSFFAAVATPFTP